MTSVSRFHRDTGLLPDSLAEMFHPSTTSGSLSADLLAEDLDALTADVEKLGDPARGELVYRRKNVACTRCHAIGSAGPDDWPESGGRWSRGEDESTSFSPSFSRMPRLRNTTRRGRFFSPVARCKRESWRSEMTMKSLFETRLNSGKRCGSPLRTSKTRFLQNH